jgi:hypothetical protein
LLQWPNAYVTAFHIINQVGLFFPSSFFSFVPFPSSHVQVLACGLSLFGVTVALLMVQHNYRHHFVSVHSWLGLLAVLFYCVQVCCDREPIEVE